MELPVSGDRPLRASSRRLAVTTMVSSVSDVTAESVGGTSAARAAFLVNRISTAASGARKEFERFMDLILSRWSDSQTRPTALCDGHGRTHREHGRASVQRLKISGSEVRADARPSHDGAGAVLQRAAP